MFSFTEFRGPPPLIPQLLYHDRHHQVLLSFFPIGEGLTIFLSIGLQKATVGQSSTIEENTFQ